MVVISSQTRGNQTWKNPASQQQHRQDIRRGKYREVVSSSTEEKDHLKITWAENTKTSGQRREDC